MMDPLSPRPVNIQSKPQSRDKTAKDNVKITIKRAEPKPKSAREKNHPNDPPAALPFPGGGSFNVLELVGLGGFAKAFRCESPKGEIFCVKVVKKDPGHAKMREKVSLSRRTC